MASLLANFPDRAGAAAGIAIATQFGLGALTSILVSSLNATSPLPMALIVGATGLGSLLALSLTSKTQAA